MAKQDLEGGKRALVIVAHPDDESIWMGGFILKNQGVSWTILSLCRASDPDRAPKFKKVCEHLKAKAIIEDMDDEGNLNFNQTVKKADELILKNLHRKKFDYIFTHGENGEYGHEAHRAVHQAVKRMIKNGDITAKKIFYFNYKKARNKKFPIDEKLDSDLLFKMKKTDFDKKKKVMTRIYGFAPDGIDVNYCTNPEAFLIENLK